MSSIKLKLNEPKNKKEQLSQLLWEELYKGSGYKLLSREDNKECKEFMAFYGWLVAFLDKKHINVS